MNRRQLLAGTCALLVTSRISSAQPSKKIARIGILGGVPNTPEARRNWESLVQGLRELGYFEGNNLVIERRFYEGNIDALPRLAAELVGLRVDVIVAGASPAPEVAQRATSTVPIVMATHTDPLRSGLIRSLARPGGNVTGSSLAVVGLRGKQLQLLKEAVPKLGRVAILLDPTGSTYQEDLKEVQSAARSLQLAMFTMEVRAPNDLAESLSRAVKERAGAALIIGGTRFIYEHRVLIAELAKERSVPTMTGLRDFVDAGCLMAYGPDLGYGFRRAAWYVDRILKGAKPGDLPIEQATTFALTINLKTAKALGLTIPSSVLVRANTTID